MKPRTLLFSVFLLVFISTSVYSDNYTSEQIENKFSSFNKMRITGYSLLFSGIFVDFVGLYFFTAGLSKMLKDDQYLDDDTDEIFPDGYFQMVTGEIGLCFGIPMAVAGAVLSSIGKRKAAAHNRRLQLTFSPSSLQLTLLF